MKLNRFKIVSLSILFLFWLAGISAAVEQSLSANEIVQKMDNRYDGDTVDSNISMLLINKNGKKRERKIKSFSKDYGKDTKGVIFFLSPANVKNTAYLSYDWNQEEKEDDSWLYLPALRKVKRISSSDESGAFMGSDFSYADINGLDISNWDYRFINENAVVNDMDTWVIEGTPKPDRLKKVNSETGYLKYRMWIRKDNFLTVKAKYQVKKGRKIKYFSADDISLIDNIWTTGVMRMVTTQKGKKLHETTLILQSVAYNQKLTDSFFTTHRIERGL